MNQPGGGIYKIIYNAHLEKTSPAAAYGMGESRRPPPEGTVPFRRAHEMQYAYHPSHGRASRLEMAMTCIDRWTECKRNMQQACMIGSRECV